MESLWKKVNEDARVATIPDGCSLTETEQKILIRLAGKLSFRELKEKGFSPDEIDVICNWSDESKDKLTCLRVEPIN